MIKKILGQLGKGTRKQKNCCVHISKDLGIREGTSMIIDNFYNIYYPLGADQTIQVRMLYEGSNER